MIKSFKEDMNVLDAPIFTDPSLEIFDACGLNRGVKFLVSPMSATKVAKLYWEESSSISSPRPKITSILFQF